MTIEQQTIINLKARIRELEEENAMLRRIARTIEADDLDAVKATMDLLNANGD